MRSISRAETPFLELPIWNTTNSQVRSGTFDPWKIATEIREPLGEKSGHPRPARFRLPGPPVPSPSSRDS